MCLPMRQIESQPRNTILTPMVRYHGVNLQPAASPSVLCKYTSYIGLHKPFCAGTQATLGITIRFVQALKLQQAACSFTISSV